MSIDSPIVQDNAKTSIVNRMSMHIDARERSLVVSFSEYVRSCSWAVIGGGFTDIRRVAWFEVHNAELPPEVSPRNYTESRMYASGITDATIMLTSRCVASYADHVVSHGNMQARCLATVGLGNALRAGDPPGVPCRVGTINLLIHIGKALSDEAMLEASSIATEAKVAAIMESKVKSRWSGLTATGTGTDCIVVTCPRTGQREELEPYAGKHTIVGSAVGESVYRSVEKGVKDWLSENRVSNSSSRSHGC